jgi:PAS domain S-box-containing protein
MGKKRHNTTEQEQRYRDFVFGFTDLIWEVDRNGLYTYVAGDTEKVLGYSAEELLGKSPFDFMDSDEAGRVRDVFLSIVKERAPIVDLLNRNIHKSGKRVSLLTNGKPFFDADGEMIGYYGVDKDITKQRDAEERVLRQQKEFETIFNTTTDGLAIIDFNGYFLEFNDAYVTLSGYSREELYQKSCIDLSIPEDVERTKEVFAEVKRKGSVNNFDKSCYRKDGSIVTIDTSIALMPDRQRLLLSAKDITAHKTLEKELTAAKEQAEALAKEQALLLSLFDKGDSVLFKWRNDPTWSIPYVSSNVSNLLGYTVEDFTSGAVPYDTCIHPDDSERVTAEVMDAIRESVDFFKHRPYRLVTKSRTIKWVLDQTVTVKNADGEIAYFVGYLTDLSEQKAAEAQLRVAKEEAERATRAKSDFLTNMSHEIRTPLNGIIGLTSLALKEPLSDKQRHYLEKSQRSSKALLNIINDILDYSRIETGQLSLNMEPLCLQEMMEDIKGLFEHRASQQGIVFSVTSPESIWLQGDAMRLSQILTHLVGNALKFTHKGSVTVSSETLDEDAEHITLNFRIKDSGIGIAEEKIEHLFDAFTQADTSETREYGGTGLGLAICRQLASLMGGEIRVSSEVGEGSEFVYTQRFEKAASPLPDICSKPKEDIGTPKTGGTGRVLVVDDSKVNQLVVLGFLEDIGVTADVAANGKEAVEQVEAKAYDLVLMDLHMPLMDGFEAGRIIHAARPELPIVALSAASMPKDIERTGAAGMCAHLAKPIDEEAFKALMHRLLPAVTINETPRDTAPVETSGVTYYGIDMEALGERMKHNAKRIKMMVESFYEHFSDPQTRRQFDQVGSDDFNAVVHALKGASGNMMMTKLFSLAKQIHESGDLSAKRAMAPLMLEELDQVLTQLGKQLSEEALPQQEQSFTREERLAHIAAIQKQLDDNRLISIDDMGRLEGMLRNAVDEALLKTVMQQLRGFEYDKARDLLRQISKALSA